MKGEWRIRTAGMFVMLTAFLIMIGLVVGLFIKDYVIGTVIMVVLSVLICTYSVYGSKNAALRVNKVRLVTQAEEPRLWNIVKKVADAADMPMPEVGIADQNMPNAFATGRSPANAAVVATNGILQALDDDELEAVFGHEMSHVKNRDILVMGVASTVASVVSFTSRIGFWMLLTDSRDKDATSMLLGILLCITVPISALLVQLGISRNREYLADETGARITGKPRDLVRALRDIEGGCNAKSNNYSNVNYADVWISDPIRKKGLMSRLFSTHPTTEDRIARLEKIADEMDGGRPYGKSSEGRTQLAFR